MDGVMGVVREVMAIATTAALSMLKCQPHLSVYSQSLVVVIRNISAALSASESPQLCGVLTQGWGQKSPAR